MLMMKPRIENLMFHLCTEAVPFYRSCLMSKHELLVSK